MTITKSLDVTAIASATSVSYKQKNQQNAANLRPEVLVCIGQAQTGKNVKTNTLNLASGNADDIGVIYGFGSPLHRMAIKLFPKAGNGSKVDTYFMAVPAPSGKAEVKTLTISAPNGVKKSLNAVLILKDMAFEAAADVAGKVATNAHNNPPKAPRGTDLNSYERTAYPFTLTKGMTVAESLEAVKEALEENLELPFTIEEEKNEDTTVGLTLTAKWTGDDSCFDFEIKTLEGENIDSSIYGVAFECEETEEGAGVGTIPDEALEELNEEFGVTRVVSQYSNTLVLDKLQEYFEAWRTDGLIAQYVTCYSSIIAPESELVAGTWDVAKLIEDGNSRRNDGVNVQIVNDYGELRKLKYPERNRLAKAGYSNLTRKADGSLRLMDLITFYHPVGNKNPIFRFDRDVTVIGNSAYDFMSYFRDSEEWKSVILIGEKDITTNPAARSLKDVKAAVNTRISLQGKAGLIANYADAQKETEVEIDENNPNRININPKFDLTGVGRIFDITNFVGFNFKG